MRRPDSRPRRSCHRPLGNAAADEANLRSVGKDFEATIEPLDRVFLAIQGPEAAEVLEKAGIATDALTFMHGTEPRQDWFMSRSGYTGEDGFEIALPESDARDLVPKLLADERVRERLEELKAPPNKRAKG